jgi:hypothetical protein
MKITPAEASVSALHKALGNCHSALPFPPVLRFLQVLTLIASRDKTATALRLECL